MIQDDNHIKIEHPAITQIFSLKEDILPSLNITKHNQILFYKTTAYKLVKYFYGQKSVYYNMKQSSETYIRILIIILQIYLVRLHINANIFCSFYEEKFAITSTKRVLHHLPFVHVQLIFCTYMLSSSSYVLRIKSGISSSRRSSCKI